MSLITFWFASFMAGFFFLAGVTTFASGVYLWVTRK